jgi:hypothetical protein
MCCACCFGEAQALVDQLESGDVISVTEAEDAE